MFYLFLLIVIILCVLHIYFAYNAKSRLLRKIPGPKEHFIIGTALAVGKDPVDSFQKTTEYAKKYNGIYRFWTFNLRVVVIYNPDDIETVISTTRHNTKSKMYTFLNSWLKEGLLLSQGTKWHRRRKILTPTFHFNILQEFCTILDENCRKMVEDIFDKSTGAIDVAPFLSEFTLHSICETAMGTRLAENSADAAKSYKQAIYGLGKIVYERVTKPYLAIEPIFNLTKLGKQEKEYLQVVSNFTDNVIEERKEHLSKKQSVNDSNESVSTSDRKKRVALLDLLLDAHRNGEIDKAGIKEEVDTFTFEGHDTTASGLTYCLMAIANHKTIQDKMIAELRAIYGDSDRPAAYEDLSHMKYIENVIKESLRLYPPVHMIGRELYETVTLSNYVVPAGTHCGIHIFHLHRREDLFPNALKFEPDRFLPENSANRHPYSYIPFSAGPRNCIGQKFAMMEMKLAVSNILRKFELLPVTTPEEVVFKIDIVLRSGPVYVKFKKRE